MAFRAFVSHLDARIREELFSSTRVGPTVFANETTVTWQADDRSVRADLGSDGRIEYVLRVAPEAFPYDRFADSLEAPDLASTAQKIAEFLNGAREATTPS